MLSTDQHQLLTHLERVGLGAVAVTYDAATVIEIRQHPFHLWIDRRQHYCDRGRWQVNVETHDVSLATVDCADMFPRYYFHDEALAMELEAWFTKRMESVNKKLRLRAGAAGD